MRKKATASFDPKTFLAKVGDGKAVSKYQKGQIIFSQGDSADAVFYILNGKIKLTVVSKRGKEAVVGLRSSQSPPNLLQRLNPARRNGDGERHGGC